MFCLITFLPIPSWFQAVFCTCSFLELNSVARTYYIECKIKCLIGTHDPRIYILFGSFSLRFVYSSNVIKIIPLYELLKSTNTYFYTCPLQHFCLGETHTSLNGWTAFLDFCPFPADVFISVHFFFQVVLHFL